MTITLSEGIQLYSGAFFDYENPQKSAVQIEDIALALSNVCRFAGHVSHFYSVAQHAVNCSFIVAPEYAYDALLHDTAEAFTNDIPTPLKFAVPVFKELEVRIERAMAAKFDFSFPLPEAVKLADLQMLKLEKEKLKPHASGDWEVLAGVIAADVAALADMTPWTPEQAYAAFMLRYTELRP
jgi:uncharacterized protein